MSGAASLASFFSPAKKMNINFKNKYEADAIILWASAHLEQTIWLPCYIRYIDQRKCEFYERVLQNKRVYKTNLRACGCVQPEES